ncbi:MAG TPA: hypothetical protein VIV11_37195 [Kofleriaceae bacterium]
MKRETIGGGTAVVQARGTVEAAAPSTIPVTRGTYEIKLRFDVPRAQLVEWAVLCPGSVQTGVAGETFDEYRARRLAELRAERERERRNVAALAGAVIGAAAPDVHAHAHASGPSGTAAVDAHVSGQATGDVAGSAIAHAAVSDDVELAAGDLGAARLHATTDAAWLDDGACSVTAIADDTDVKATFELVRVRDLGAEARARQLADPKVQARIAVQTRLRGEALHTRAELIAYLTGECNAREDHREYLREQPLVIRALLREYLISIGARVRPPRPAPQPENPGNPPYEDAEWISGEWRWTGIEWLWERGTWRDAPVVRDHRTTDSNVRDHRDEVSVRDHRSEPIVRDHRNDNVRDHRSEPKQESKPVVRDHRDDDNKSKDKDKDDDKRDNAPRVRDHRR